jgi:hypothetical protein
MRSERAILDAPPGQRNATLNQQAFIAGGLVGAGVIPEHLAVVTLYNAGRYAGLDDSETKGTIRSGFNAGLRRPLDRRDG